MIDLLFVIICFIFDEALTVLFPNSYLMNTLLFIPSLGFCAMILIVRKFSIIDTCLFSFVCGMFYDVFLANTFLLHAIVFTIAASLLHLWTKHLTDTALESILLVIVTIFVKDFLVYLYMSFQQVTEMSLMLWAERYELLTLLGNGVLSFVILFFIRMKDDYLERKALQVRKGEKIEWFKLKSKQ